MSDFTWENGAMKNLFWAVEVRPFISGGSLEKINVVYIGGREECFYGEAAERSLAYVVNHRIERDLTTEEIIHRLLADSQPKEEPKRKKKVYKDRPTAVRNMSNAAKKRWADKRKRDSEAQKIIWESKRAAELAAQSINEEAGIGEIAT